MGSSATKACRRTLHRVALGRVENAVLEFEHPVPRGRLWEAQLEDISVSGLSFVMPPEAPGIDSGASFSGVKVRVGSCEVRGDLLVMHITPHSDSKVVCGALFYPATDTDLVKLKSMLAGVEAALQS